MKTIRYLLLEQLYEYSKKPYKLLFKKEVAWGISVSELLSYPPNTLGYHLGCFLLKYHFTPEPQLENHDVFHVITATGISVPEEISMQFLLLGNGKRSLYLLLVICIGSILFPDHWSVFKTAFYRGKKAHRLYDLNYVKLLHTPLHQLQSTLNII